MQALYPLGDVDLLDAYHLCGGRVVTFCTSGAGRLPSASTSRSGEGDDHAARGRRDRYERLVSTDGVDVGFCDHNYSLLCDARDKATIDSVEEDKTEKEV